MGEKNTESISALIDDVGPLRSTALGVEAADALMKQIEDENQRLLEEAQETHADAKKAMAELDGLNGVCIRFLDDEHADEEWHEYATEDILFVREEPVASPGSFFR